MKKIGFLFAFVCSLLCLVSCGKEEKVVISCFPKNVTISDTSLANMEKKATNIIYVNIESFESLEDNNISFKLSNIEYIKGEVFDTTNFVITSNYYVWEKGFRLGSSGWSYNVLYDNVIKDNFKVYFYLVDDGKTINIIDSSNALCLSNEDVLIYDSMYYND